MTLDVDTFDCSDVGPNVVTLTVTDIYGNTSQCSATVTVEDNTAPVITCIGEPMSSDIMVNGSFESGDFAGWTAIDNPNPFIPWGVYPFIGSPGLDLPDAFPTDGALLAGNGFDGDSGEAILFQDVTVPAGFAATLSWDENIDYNITFCAPCSDRIYEVQVRDLADNVLEVLQHVDAIGGTLENDNVWESLTADLSAYAGQDIRIAFWQNIPASFEGPAKFAVDNVSLEVTNTVAPLVVELDANGMATLDASDLLINVDEACGWTATIGGGGGGAACATGVYTDRGDFETETGGELVFEDWAGGPGGINGCDDVISSAGDSCFPPGEIQPGIEITTNTPGNGTLTLGAGEFGLLHDGVGTNFFTDYTIINFPNNDVNSFGFDLYSLLGGSNVEVRIFGAGGLLDTQMVDVTSTGPVFFGYIADETIVSVELEDPNGLDVEIITQTLFGECGGGSGGTTIDFTCADLGMNQIDITVTDDSGNTATCTATVEVLDVTSPVLVCEDVTIELDEDGVVEIDPQDLLAYSETIYEVITISSDNGSAAEGWTDFTVNVTDPDTVSFDWDYTTDDGALWDSFGYLLNGVYTQLTDDNGSNQQSGNSGPINVAPGDVFGFRSLSVDGDFGPSTTTISNFMPGFTGQFDPSNWNLELTNSDGDAYFVEFPGGPLSFDACGITVWAVDVTEVTCDDVGAPIVITVFASDASGNIASCQATVTVVDLLAPEIVCPEDQSQDPGPGNLLYEVPDYWGAGEGGTLFSVNNGPLEGDYVAVAAAFGGEIPDIPLTEDTALVIDDDTTGDENDACDPITNGASLDGKIAVLRRGSCQFGLKALSAQNEGAIAVIVVNNQPGDPIVMGGGDDGDSVTIPAVMVSDVDGEAIIAELEGGGTVNVSISTAADGEASATDNCTDPVVVTGQDPAAGTLLPDGVYTVTVWAEDEYGNYSECTFELTVESILGNIDNELNSAIAMYPNPANDLVTIANSSNIVLDTAVIYDVTGKLVSQIDLHNMQDEKVIDVSALASGVYMVQITGEQSTAVKRLIKE
jgi:hypothetical protein